MIEQPLRVLVVESESSLGDCAVDLFRETYHYQVDIARDAEKAFEFVVQSKPPYQVVLIDDVLKPADDKEPEPCGIELMTRIKGQSPLTEVIIRDGDTDRALSALRAGAFHCLTKTISPDDLAIYIRYATEYRQIQEQKSAEAARRNEQLTERVGELDALRRTTLVITSLLNRKTLLTRIIEQALWLLSAKSGGIYEYHPERAELTIVAEHGRPDYVGEILKVGEGMAGRLVQSDEPFMIIDNYNEWPGRAHIYESGRPFGAVLQVLLKWENSIIGVLYVDDDVGRKFDERQARLLGLFGEQAAITLVNADLLIKDDEKLHRLEKLSRISSEIVDDLSSMGLDNRLNLIARRAAEILEAEACGICVVKRDGFLSWEASYGPREEVFTKGKEFEIKSTFGGGLTGHIASQGRLFNAWGANLTGHWAVRRDEKNRGRCYSLLALPLKKGDQLIGLLRVENKLDNDGEPRRGLHFTQEDEWILNSFGQAVVVAIEEAKLVGELSEQKDYLARLIGSSLNGIIAIDRQANVTTFNERAEQIQGYRKDEVMGKPVAQLYSDPKEPHNIGRLLHLNGGKLTNHETCIKSKDGELIPINISATWLYDADKNRIGSVGYFEDLRIAKQKDRHLELLLKASDIIAQAESMNEGLQRLAEMMVSLLTSTFCRILLLDETEQSLVPKAAYPIPRPFTKDLSWTPGLEEPISLSDYPSLSEHLEAGRPRVLTITKDIFNPSLVKLSRRLGLENNIQSLLIVPLKIGNRVVGLLDVGELRKDKRTSFTREKIDLASAIAAQTKTLIERMRLHEITERRRALLEALDEASRRIRAVRETPKLMQEVVRLGAELVGCEAGGLYLNRPHLKQLELSTTYGLTPDLVGTQLPHEEGLIGLVARTRESKIIYKYSNWADREAIFEPFNFKTVVAIPLEHAGEIDAVLFVADARGHKQFVKTDLKILERFAAQASIALQTSLLMNQEQKISSQLAIRNKMSDYIQSADDLTKILHVVLTGVTADYGLRFNRALLLLLDERQEYLIGRMGIGQFDKKEARKAWAQDNEHRLYDFGHYLELLEKNELPHTPVGEWVDKLQLPVDAQARDPFSRTVLERHWIVVKPEEVGRLPVSFAEPFAPTSALGIVPLVFRNEVMGVLIVDNKFTQSPITDEDVNSLMTFANVAAIAIYNTRLLDEVRSGSEKLFSFYKVSSDLTAIQDPVALRRAIVEQTHIAAGATWVSLLLIDEMGRAQNPFTVGEHTHRDDAGLIRPSGRSMQVMRTGEAVIMEDLSNQPQDYVNPVMLQGRTKAAICLPLSLPDKRIGVMWIHYDKFHHFPQSEIAALQLYVNQAASAYESALRMEKVERMRRAAEALAEADDLSRVLDQIVESAREVLEADSTVLWFYDAEADNFILEASVAAGIKGEAWNELRRAGPSKRGTAYQVMKREWVPVGDIGDEQQSQLLGETTRKLLDEIGARGFQGIVLNVGEERLGVLYANYNRPCAFGDKEQQTARTFGNHAALALKKAKLLDQLKRARKAAAAVAKVTALGDRRATLASIAKETMNAVSCDAVVLFEYDKATLDVIHPPTMEGVRYPEKAMSSEEIVDYELVRKIVNLDEPYVVERIAEDPDFKDRRFARTEETKSCVALPLRAGRDKMGVMFVNYRRQRRFTRDELENIELFGNQAAVAIRNAQLFEERAKKLREQTALVKLSNELIATETVRETMNAAVRVAAEVLSTQYCNIVLLDQRGKLAFVAAVGWPQSLVGKLELESGRGSQTGYTVEMQGPVRVDDYCDRRAREFDVPPIVFEHRIKSGMSVPMFRGSDVIGAMLVHTITPRLFSEADESVLSLIANNTAIAIQSAERYEASLRKGAYLHALYEAGKAITASFGLDRERVLDLIVQQAVEGITGTEGRKAFLGTLQLYDEEKNELITESVYPIEEYQGELEIGAARILDVSKVKNGRIGISGRTAITKQQQLVPDVSIDGDYVEFNHATRSEVAVPLIDQGRVLGVLDVECKEMAGFDEEDMNTLRALADLAVIVIKNAEHYEELKRKNEELRQTQILLASRTTLSWMGMANSTWRHAIEGHAVSIRSVVSLMRQDFSRWQLGLEISKQLEGRLRHIESLAAKIWEKKLTPPLSSEEGAELISINLLLRERIAQLRETEPYQNVDFNVNLSLDDLKIKVSPEWFRRALDMLIDNAVDAMANSPQRLLTVTTRLNREQVEIIIADTGEGIPPGIKEGIFRGRIEKPTRSKGFGTGLLMVQMIVQTYNGHIRLEETGPCGTTFVISLPAQE
jgi:PAS domain S-box-containing protein